MPVHERLARAAGVTRKIDTGSLLAARAAVGDVEIAVAVEDRVVHLMQAGRQNGVATSVHTSVAPGAHDTLTGCVHRHRDRRHDDGKTLRARRTTTRAGNAADRHDFGGGCGSTGKPSP